MNNETENDEQTSAVSGQVERFVIRLDHPAFVDVIISKSKILIQPHSDDEMRQALTFNDRQSAKMHIDSFLNTVDYSFCVSVINDNRSNIPPLYRIGV